ncbi:MAG: hypothetical protein ACXVI6_05600, partial [Candidatus Aminicenantales bacterium]
MDRPFDLSGGRPRDARNSAVRWPAARVLLANPKILKVRPSLSLPLLRYMKKFRLRDVGGNLILHSHLPPLNGAPYGRFIADHLLGGSEGPSHAQVALTNACPQKCAD